VANADRISIDGTERPALRVPVAFPPSGAWRQASAFEQIIRFYHTEEELAAEVAGFIGPGLRAVEGGIVLAAPAHRRAIADRLLAQGIDLTGALARRQYISLDAQAALATFLVDEMPDESLFRSTIGYVITRMLSAGFRVRVFSEMSALLCAQENFPAATRLNQLWCDLGKRRNFSLFRACPAERFAAGVNDACFQAAGAAGSAAVPAPQS
jgi:hypothetical protein